MLFNSVKYMVFLPLAVLIYFIIPLSKKYSNKNIYRNIFLLVISYYFYMCWIPKYAILISVSTVTTYLASILLDKIENKKWRRVCLVLNLLINLGILFVFKYYNFFFDNIMQILNNIGLEVTIATSSLLLPVGISFYTFQAIGYTIDVYRKNIECEKNFINYALFVTFFPQLVAGPIERSTNLLPQFRQIHTFDYTETVKGLRIILIGLFKKVVIADTVAIYVDAVFNNPYSYTGLNLILAVFLFSIQIYCDFSGYSDIAVGSAKILRFKLMENFNAPYFSESIGEFWNRWHISLNTWFKDYVYIPLGGNKKGVVRKCLNLLTVFILSGLWHGASWTFVIWGILNGLYRVIQEIIRKSIKPLEFNYSFLYAAKKVVKILFTYVLICFTWIFFRANALEDAIYIIRNLFTNIDFRVLVDNCYNIVNENILNLTIIRYFYYSVIIISIIVLFIMDIIRCKDTNEKKSLEDIAFNIKFKSIRWILYIVFTILIIWMFIMQNGIFGQTGAFIYFQF